MKLFKFNLTKGLPRSKSFREKDFTSGFTLIEMIVVIVIVIIISTISILQIAQQRKGAYLQTTADTIALDLRNAQILALSVRSSGGIIPNYKNGYGIHFELGGGNGSAQGANEKSYILFTDYEAGTGPGGWDRAYLQNSNMVAACGSPNQTIDECVSRNVIDSGDKITGLSLCSTLGGTPSCSSSQTLDITFLRPNLDAYFCSAMPSSGGCFGLVPTVGYAEITVTSLTNATRAIKVWSTGQISVE